MLGAKKYSGLFITGQYGKLYIAAGRHARGFTFHVQVLPEGVNARPNGEGNLCLNDDAVEVYGIVSGQAGWTERYGWIHEGKWQDDFNKLVISHIEEYENSKESSEKLHKLLMEIKLDKQKNLLAKY